MIKEQLGLEPTKAGDNIYTPSPTVINMMVRDKSGYKKVDYPNKYKGDKKILFICTEENHLEMKNGKIFLTGNHPIETFVPTMHFDAAGFQYDFATPTGKSMKIEEWAYPTKDPEFDALMKRLKPMIDKPLKMTDAIKKLEKGDYFAVFIPGGHGAVLGLPHDKNVGKAIQIAKKQDLFFMVICHGPAALLAAADGAADEDFIFKGYAMAAFPDGMDRQLPYYGYLPGEMPWYFGKRLEALGVDIVSRIARGKTHVDRKMISGDSPMAANEMGEIAAKAMLEAMTKQPEPA